MAKKIQGDYNLITFPQAVEYISAMGRLCDVDITGNKDLSKAFTENNFGAKIPANYLFGNPVHLREYRGVKGWLCYDKTANEIFLCFHGVDHWSPDNIDDTSEIPDTIYRPHRKGIFKCLKTSTQTWENYLLNDKEGNGLVVEYDREYFDAETAEFLTEFPKRKNSPVPVHLGGSIFFNDDVNRDIRAWITKGNLTHVRYYFGWDTEMAESGYGLRVIIFGVKPDGKNLIEYSDGDKYAIVQKSWPPVQ